MCTWQLRVDVLEPSVFLQYMFDIKRLQTIKQEYWQRVEVPANCLPPSNRLCGLSQGRQLILSRLRLLFCMFHKVLRVSNGPLLLRLQSVESATRTGPASATTTPTLTWQRRRVRRRRRRRWARPLHVARTTTNVRCRLAFNYVEQQKASLSASSGMSWCLSWHTHKHYIFQKISVYENSDGLKLSEDQWQLMSPSTYFFFVCSCRQLRRPQMAPSSPTTTVTSAWGTRTPTGRRARPRSWCPALTVDAPVSPQSPQRGGFPLKRQVFSLRQY